MYTEAKGIIEPGHDNPVQIRPRLVLHGLRQCRKQARFAVFFPCPELVEKQESGTRNVLVDVSRRIASWEQPVVGTVYVTRAPPHCTISHAVVPHQDLSSSTLPFQSVRFSLLLTTTKSKVISSSSRAREYDE